MPHKQRLPNSPSPWVAPTNPSNLLAQEAPERGVLGSLRGGLAGSQLGGPLPHPPRATTAAVSAGYLSGSDILMVQVVAHVPRTPWGHSSGLNRLLAYSPGTPMVQVGVVAPCPQ